MARVCQHPRIWRDMLARDFDDTADDAATSHAANGGDKNYRRQYEEKYRNVHNARAVRIKVKEAEERVRVRRYREQQSQAAYSCYQRRAMSIALPLMVLLTTIFVVERLDQEIEWNMASVLWPMWVLFIMLGVAMAWTCIGTFMMEDHWLFRGIQGERHGCVPLFSRSVMGGNPVGNFVGVCMAAMLFLFTLLLAMRLDETITWRWATVFVPMWVTFLLTCVTPFTGWWGSHPGRQCSITWCLGLAPLLAFFITLVVHLDGAGIDAELVAIPLWIVDSAFIVIPFIASIIALIGTKCRYYTCEADEAGNLVAICLLSWAAFVPVTVFEILAVLKIRDVYAIDWSTVFSPLLLWETGILAAAIYYSLLS